VIKVTTGLLIRQLERRYIDATEIIHIGKEANGKHVQGKKKTCFWRTEFLLGTFGNLYSPKPTSQSETISSDRILASKKVQNLREKELIIFSKTQSVVRLAGFGIKRAHKNALIGLFVWQVA
jgi:hypothetical protein